MDSIQLHDKHFVPFITRDKIDRYVQFLSDQIADDMDPDEIPIFIGILNGSFMFAADFVRKYPYACHITFVKMASYEGVSTSGKIKHLVGINEDLEGKTVVILEDIIDTLNGSNGHSSSNIGSSSSTPMMKFFARMGGMRVEFIVHTNKTYLDYMYKKDVSHDEYEVKRIFDSGVADLLFPREIYHLDMTAARNQLIRWFRQRIENY